jgi:hypothetical protein
VAVSINVPAPIFSSGRGPLSSEITPEVPCGTIGNTIALEKWPDYEELLSRGVPSRSVRSE